MKICPTCKETYKDEDLNFCLADGTTLIKKKTGVTTRHSRLNEIIAVVLLAALATSSAVTAWINSLKKRLRWLVMRRPWLVLEIGYGPTLLSGVLLMFMRQIDAVLRQMR